MPLDFLLPFVLDSESSLLILTGHGTSEYGGARGLQILQARLLWLLSSLVTWGITIALLYHNNNLLYFKHIK